MAILKPEELGGPDNEEARHNTIADAIVGGTPVIPGVACVRDVTPLVMLALLRANNPFITNRKGFEAIGVEFDRSGKQITDPATFAMLIMPKTAEILILLSCSREDLKRFGVDPAALEDAALELMDTSSMEDLAEGMLFVSGKLEQISKSRAAKSPEGEKPGASVLTKKKRGRTG